MNDFEVISKVIRRRRSIFPASYTHEPLSQETITAILESANYAPTHKLTQPWRFTVMTGEAKTRLGAELARLYRAKVPAEKFLQKKHDSFAEKTRQAACIMAINIQFHPEQLPGWEEIAATACAVQNMALTAESLGIGAYWSSPALIHDLDGFLELQPGEKCYGLFYMGHHGEAPREAKRTPIAEKVRWMS